MCELYNQLLTIIKCLSCLYSGLYERKRKNFKYTTFKAVYALDIEDVITVFTGFKSMKVLLQHYVSSSP